MSYVEDQDVILSEKASFWEPKCFIRTVKRLENANKLTSDFSQLVAERASIENSYSENLRKWSSKWSSLVSTGIEYGTGAQPWNAVCEEANQISDMHKKNADVLTQEIQAQIKRWQKEQFHKSHVPGQTLKEAKMLEHEFETAQKPWSKKLKKLSQCKKDYYLACKHLSSLKVQAENAYNDPSGTQEQLKKIQEKTKRAETDQSRTQAAYQGAVSELKSDESRYQDDMRRVFDKSQGLEQCRLAFFKQMFIGIYEALDLSKKHNIESIYTSMVKTIGTSSPEEDLTIWSNNHGINMPFVCPQFEVRKTVFVHDLSGLFAL
ncbi:Protein kinase C and casein kinase substrate in neurons protein 2 [Cichlidogyrus casuarinus]|uniref:Protein kinase C and casein kinase substrate in neurons protein 2 n=1 Tax=Cichlidogyrus casuarinus TaxID=1844966 RepID=A0ABD2Q385_9PLAT